MFLNRKYDTIEWVDLNIIIALQKLKDRVTAMFNQIPNFVVLVIAILIFKGIRQLTMFINGIFSSENLNLLIENFEKVRLSMMSLFFYTYRLGQLLYAVR